MKKTRYEAMKNVAEAKRITQCLEWKTQPYWRISFCVVAL